MASATMFKPRWTVKNFQTVILTGKRFW